MVETKFSCFWHGPDLGRDTQAAVSLHGHTNRSKESLQLIPQLARKGPMLHEALEKQCRRSRIPVDFSRAYWAFFLPGVSGEPLGLTAEDAKTLLDAGSALERGALGGRKVKMQ
jgi:hypothetical protein